MEEFDVHLHRDQAVLEQGEIWLLTLYPKNVAESISGRTLKMIKEEIDG